MDKDFLLLGGRLERWLLRMVVLAAVMLVSIRWFAYDPVLQAIGKADDQLNTGAGFSGVELQHLVTLQMQDFTSLPKATVLVNDEPRGTFQNRYVTVSVWPGDVLKIDTKFYRHPVSFQVVETYGDVQWPAKGAIFTVEGAIQELGRIVVKECK